MPSKPPSAGDGERTETEPTQEEQSGGQEQDKDCDCPVIALSPTHKVQFGPDHVYMQNGGMFVLFDDNDGITIKSDADVLIRATNNVTISSSADDISVVGDALVSIVQGGASLTFEGMEILASGEKIFAE